MSFIRRYGFFPGTEVITQIEGVIIVDLPPPGAITAVGTGTVAMVGEFADMTFGVTVDTSGNVTTKPQPVELFSSQDMLNKVGGFDETIGDTGDAGGNAFISLRNKRFSRIIAVPVNLASGKGVREFRQLPTNKGATDPTPVVLLQAATVAAGREFKTGTSRARSCAAVGFTATGAYKQATDGSVTAAGGPAATQTFSSASGAFLSAKNNGPVQKGDLVVIGVIGGALGLGANADTYRVNTDAVSDTQLVLEKLDGSSFDWTTTASLPYRVHPSSDGDTGGHNNVADAGGYTIPARPLDATIAAATTVTPTLNPPAPTATSWDPLSGLKLRTIPVTGLVFDTNTQAPNAINHSELDALYSTAIDALLTNDLPGRDVNIVVASRHSQVIRNKLHTHVDAASGQGLGRTAMVSTQLSTQSTATAIGDADPGVGANRDERVDYAWPGAQTFVPEAVNFNMKGADSLVHTNGQLDTHLDAWLASVLSVLPPELNPAQEASPVTDILAPILGIQRGVVGLAPADYVQFRQKGVVALLIDKNIGPIFQSGITTSLTPGQKNINRRRMADFLEDSIAQALKSFSKQLLTNALKDTVVGEIDAFLSNLKSVNNPPAQRIADYSIDDVSGNTPSSLAAGIFVVIVNVKTLSTADFIVLQANVGENVTVTSA